MDRIAPLGNEVCGVGDELPVVLTKIIVSHIAKASGALDKSLEIVLGVVTITGEVRVDVSIPLATLWQTILEPHWDSRCPGW